MKLMAELYGWLEANQLFLRECGHDFLDLDPAHEKIRLNRGLVGGVHIHTGFNEPIILGGMRGRKPAGTNGTGLPQWIDPRAIVHDHPGETVDEAIDWLAFYRVWRSLGAEQPMPEWFRVSTCALDTMESVGIATNDYYEALLNLAEDDVGYATVTGSPTQSKETAPLLLYSQRRRTFHARVIWFHGIPGSTRLNLKMLPGKGARSDGRFNLPYNISEAVAHAARGRPLSDLISHPVTDPYDLKILGIHQDDGCADVFFNGAEHLRQCQPIFRDWKVGEMFAEEVSRLAEARALLLTHISTSALPDQWWEEFEELISKGSVPPFSENGSKKRSRVWMPADPMQDLIRSVRGR